MVQTHSLNNGQTPSPRTSSMACLPQASHQMGGHICTLETQLHSFHTDTHTREKVQQGHTSWQQLSQSTYTTIIFRLYDLHYHNFQTIRWYSFSQIWSLGHIAGRTLEQNLVWKRCKIDTDTAFLGKLISSTDTVTVHTIVETGFWMTLYAA